MNAKSIFYLYTIFIITFFSILSGIKGVDVNEIKDEKIEGILEETYSFSKVNDEAYFLYPISNEDNLLFTINCPYLRALTINCIFASTFDDETIANLDDNNNICNTFYNVKDSTPILRMYNVIPSFEGYKSGSNLYIKIKSKKIATITIFVRKEGSFLNDLETKKYSNTFSHYVFEFIPSKYFSNEYLLTSSEANSIFIFGDKNKTIESIDTTSVLVINEKSLSAHFWEYDKIYIFIGKKEFKSEENYDININKTTYNNNIGQLYYYIPSFTSGFLSFYYHCSDETTNHYLIVNYGNVGDKSYYKFHNLIGSKSSLTAVLPEGNVDFKNLEYSPIKRFNYLNITDTHLQVLKFQCSGNGNKINVNIKYGKMPTKSSDKGDCNSQITRDFLHDFSKDNSLFSISYNALESNEFALEIFTPDNENDIDFNVTFEGHPYVINNKNAFLYNVKDKEYQNILIVKEANISAIISISPSFQKSNDILNYNYYFSGDNYYYYYEINHEYNTNYTVDFDVKYNGKKDVSLFSLCYYLTNTALIQKSGQNCILVPTKNKYYMKMKNIFRYENNAVDFNKEEPKYHLVLYSNEYYNFNVNLTTDLRKSISIDQKYTGQEFIYLKANLEENKNSYFNIKMESKSQEKYLDLYILSETPEYEDKLKFEIKCIMKYELAINFIEQYFTEEYNRCYIVNKYDYNSNVYHILFNATKDDYYDDFIIKITSKENMQVKFVFNENAVVETFPIENTIKTFNDQTAYKIIELNKTSFSSIQYKNILFFDKDINGIELYARKKNDFIQIFKGSFYIIDPKDLINKYNNYDKLLFVYGKSDCGDYCKTSSYYQIKLLQYFSYISIPEFPDYYRFPVIINNCVKGEPYYILFSYGKEYKKEKLYISKLTFYGKINNNYYIDRFSGNNFESNTFYFHNYNKIEENPYHLSVIKFNCENSLFTYFDYFTKINYAKEEIKLIPGATRFYIIQNNTKFTFNYASINEIRINLLLNDEDKDNKLTINFEDRELELNNNKPTITLYRQINDTNIFNLTAPFIIDIPILITTLVKIEDLPKTEINDLYKYEEEFIYNIQPKTKNITFVIIRNKPGSRLLLEEEGNEKEIKICYNVANIVLLEKNEGNCFYVKDRYEFVYTVPEGGEEDYLVFYPIEENEQFDIIQIEPSFEGDKDSDKNNGDDKEKGKKKKKGVSGFVIFLIVLLVLIIIAVIVLLVIKYTKKTVTSEDIEKNIKTPTPIVN